MADAVGDAGTVSVSIAWRAGLSAVSAAGALGDPRSSLVTMLAAQNIARVRSVSGTLSPDGACLALRFRVEADAATSGGAQRIAQTIALAQTKARDALAEATDDVATPSDAAAAAEQASLVALASADDVADFGADDRRRRAGRDERDARVAREGARGRDARVGRADRRSALARRARAARGVDARRVAVRDGRRSRHGRGRVGRVRGGRRSSRAGARRDERAVDRRRRRRRDRVRSERERARRRARSHGARRSARRRARGAGHASRRGAPGPRGARASRSRQADLRRSCRRARRCRSCASRSPRSSRAASRFDTVRFASRCSTTRTPRTATIARVDRWVLREGARACPAQAAIAPPKPGTYAVATDDGTSEVYLALAVPPQWEAEAVAIAGVLDRDCSRRRSRTGSRASRAHACWVLPAARALVVHVEAPASALDAAVAQTRALLDRVRQGAIADADLARHVARTEDDSAATMRDPRERLIALFRGEPRQGRRRRSTTCARPRPRSSTTTRSSSSPRDRAGGRREGAVARRRESEPRWFAVDGDEVCLLRDGARGVPRDARGDRRGRARGAPRDVLGRPRRASASRFRDALAARARAGVRVRVIYDAVGSLSITPGFWASLVRAGGEVVPFHSVFPLRNTLTLDVLERRDHRKLLVVDGKIGFTGGINLRRQWLPQRGGRRRLARRHDRGARRGRAGAPHALLRHVAPSDALAARRPTCAPFAAAGRGASSCSRTRGESAATCAASTSVASTSRRTRIDIANSYFVPNRSVRGALFRAALRGVRVRVLVPERGDVRVVQFARRGALRAASRARRSRSTAARTA